MTFEATDFSSTERQRIFEALLEHRQQDGSELVRQLTDVTDYGNILLLRGRAEFTELAPADRSFEAFGLARRLQMASNKDRKYDIKYQTARSRESR